ncbi:hypothetical protein TNCV_3661511 [Trichonephila clavipes]|nr:hypothetical protein TNCV_3661511 [Trichonephila clavipes]
MRRPTHRDETQSTTADFSTLEPSPSCGMLPLFKRLRNRAGQCRRCVESMTSPEEHRVYVGEGTDDFSNKVMSDG